MSHLIMTSSKWDTSGASSIQQMPASLRGDFRGTQCSRLLLAGERPDLDTVLMMRPCPGTVDHFVIALSAWVQSGSRSKETIQSSAMPNAKSKSRYASA